jgi:hypothetical protein
MGLDRVNLAMAFKVMALNIRRFARSVSRRDKYATEQIRLKAFEKGNWEEMSLQNTA